MCFQVCVHICLYGCVPACVCVFMCYKVNSSSHVEISHLICHSLWSSISFQSLSQALRVTEMSKIVSVLGNIRLVGQSCTQIKHCMGSRGNWEETVLIYGWVETEEVTS